MKADSIVTSFIIASVFVLAVGLYFLTKQIEIIEEKIGLPIQVKGKK